MSLYKQYIEERTSDNIIESEQGFVVYRFLNETQVFIVDLFIAPQYRRQHIAIDMIDQVVAIAKAKGCNEMVATVIPSTKIATESMKACLIGGNMKILSSSNDIIILHKEI